MLVSCGVLELRRLDPAEVVEMSRHLIVVSTLRESGLANQLVTLTEREREENKTQKRREDGGIHLPTLHHCMHTNKMCVYQSRCVLCRRVSMCVCLCVSSRVISRASSLLYSLKKHLLRCNPSCFYNHLKDFSQSRFFI